MTVFSNRTRYGRNRTWYDLPDLVKPFDKGACRYRMRVFFGFFKKLKAPVDHSSNYKLTCNASKNIKEEGRDNKTRKEDGLLFR